MAGWECDHDLPGILYCPATVKLAERFARLRSQADRLRYFVSALADKGWERQHKGGPSQPGAQAPGFLLAYLARRHIMPREYPHSRRAVYFMEVCGEDPQQTPGNFVENLT